MSFRKRWLLAFVGSTSIAAGLWLIESRFAAGFDAIDWPLLPLAPGILPGIIVARNAHQPDAVTTILVTGFVWSFIVMALAEIRRKILRRGVPLRKPR